MNIIVTLGSAELLGVRASSEDVAATLRALDRDEVIRFCTRMIATLARDRPMHEKQQEFVRWLPPEAGLRYEQQSRLMRSEGSEVRLFHPFQQLILIHAAARYCEGKADAMPPEAKSRHWALAAIQVNDLMVKSAIPDALSRPEKALRLISEEVTRWELSNPSHPNRSVARLRALVVSDVPKAGAEEAEAARRIRDLLATRVGVDFETAANLTAFLVYWWLGQSEAAPLNPDAGTFQLGTWLAGSNISIADQRTYLQRVSMTPDEIKPKFDRFGGMSFHELMPFRRRPLLNNGDDRYAYLSPQFATEKGGVDLLWLATHEKGGPKESRPWTDDFGILYERYVRMILERCQLGGRFVPDVRWSEEKGGQIDGLIHVGQTLFVIETKASLLSQQVLGARGVEDVRRDIEKKFVGGPDDRKGIIADPQGHRMARESAKAGCAGLWH